MVSEWPIKYMFTERKYLLIILSTQTIQQHIFYFKAIVENVT